jgi:ABC-type transport system involved in cytochrome c biogenesis ATPase subunit
VQAKEDNSKSHQWSIDKGDMRRVRGPEGEGFFTLLRHLIFGL